MNDDTIRTLAQKMRERRERIFTEVADTEEDLRGIAQDRESELEERAQEERAARLLARLDDRGKQEIEEIDEALRRIARGAFGICEGCAEAIGVARLTVLPEARLCIECARAEEATARRYGPRRVEAPRKHPGPLPDDKVMLSGSELETSLRELVREDGRVDMEELRIVCRHGVVHLEGALPSEAEHLILLRLIEDVAGLTEVDDRLEIRELLWQREDRAAGTGAAERPRGRELVGGTEDIVESNEEGVNYSPPGGPTPDEE